MRLLLVAALCTQLCGCAGGYLMSMKTYTPSDATISAQKGFYRHKSLLDSDPTQRDVLAAWGAPDKVKRKDGKEYWVYSKEDRSWVGAALFVGIPIPLMLPVGRESTTLSFSDGKLSGIELHAKSTVGGLCAVTLPGPCAMGPPGCMSDSAGSEERYALERFKSTTPEERTPKECPPPGQ